MQTIFHPSLKISKPFWKFQSCLFMLGEQFCTKKHTNIAFIQFDQGCNLVHVSSVDTSFTSCNVLLIKKLGCVWLRIFLRQKGSPLWMPMSCSILNQMRQFQWPWVCPQIVYNFSLHSNTKPVEGLTTEKPTILMCSLTGLSTLISMERKQMSDKQ
jgi:hypothetical protein